MRAKILAVLSILLTGAAAVADEPVPVPKEGSYGSMAMGSATLKFLAQGKERTQLTWEFLGASATEDGKGPTNGASLRCLGSASIVNGEYKAYTAFCVFTRPDGDQIFATDTVVGKAGPGARGTGTFTGGTGKMAGITGGYEFTRSAMRPAAEGTGQYLTRSRVTYRLP